MILKCNAVLRGMWLASALLAGAAWPSCVASSGGGGGSVSGSGSVSGGGDTTATGDSTSPRGSDSGGATTGGGTELKTASGYCAAVVDALCGAQASCHVWTTKAACLAAPETINSLEKCIANVGQDLLAVQSGKVSLDTASLGACLTKASNVCSSSAEITQCSRVALKGSRKPGDPCTTTPECAPAGHCKAGAAACQGVCQKYAQVGEGCGPSASDAQCAAGAYCAAATCAALKTKGVPCDGGGDCGAGLTCAGGSCRTLAELQSYCKPGPEDGCVTKSTSCTTTSAGVTKCVPTLAHYVTAGAACGGDKVEVVDGVNVTRVCQKGLHCDASASTCVADFAVGTACAATKAECASTLCDGTAKCVAVPGEGAACVKFCAAGLRCIAGKCGKRLADGAACNSGSDCQSDTCSGNVCAALCAIP